MKTNIFILTFILLLAGCSENKHFITDEKYRTTVENDFKRKKDIFSESDNTLFKIFDEDLSLPEREALIFLYAYMPIGDITDYDGHFYLENVRSSFKTRQEMSWGKDIPETIFRHFVLPVRVNNENMDESRMVFYNELKNRVRDLSLHDAVLEVNHWCHEKVTYTPSDSRTSAPLASMRTAYGRCGEESTFTVAALRSVGIPARQVYTPRWAHTDDNHAWVEVWVDGKWYFLGACEPEPVLNLGWFNAPAYRGMLMHTKAFGNYDGPEEVMEKTNCYTEINVIDNYAPAAKINVLVTDSSRKPIENATVEFKVYNYAEFYSVARKKTDNEGLCSLSAGKGDMLVWASKNGLFGYKKVSFGKDTNVSIVLDKTPGTVETVELDIVPPKGGTIPAENEVTDEMRAENDKRLKEENDIRNNYMSTFYTSEKAEALAKKMNLEPQIIEKYMTKSCGNYDEIEKYIRANQKDNYSLYLLDEISDKDLRDTKASVLEDHLKNTPSIYEKAQNYINANGSSNESSNGISIYKHFLLNPRISNELLTPYKTFFAKNIDASIANIAVENPKNLVEWVKKNIAVKDELNPQRIPIMPTGVWKGRVADSHSRDIFFVAVARSLGIPAQIEPTLGKVQYLDENGWQDVDFKTAEHTNSPQGQLSIKWSKNTEFPKYYTHFSIAKLRDNAQLQTLDYEHENDMGGGKAFKKLQSDYGNYLLVSGTRMASGKVLARLVFFPIDKDSQTVELIMREDKDDVQVIGNVDAETVKYINENGEESSILQTSGRGYYIVGILGIQQEPTNHALRDIARLKDDFEKWNRSMILLLKDENSLNNFNKQEFGALPATVSYGFDKSGDFVKMITDGAKLKNSDNLPIFIIGDTFGRIVFVSQGYTIGLGEQMMKVINKL